VLDARNRPLAAPDAFQINTSLQRALVKAIALHGLGLYIYSGEDLPQPVAEAANDGAPPDTAKVTSITKISRSQQVQIHKLALEVGIELSRVLAYFGVRDLKEVESTDFQRVMRSLEKRRTAA
jgi:hypothetical protein